MQENLKQQFSAETKSLPQDYDFWRYIYDCCQRLEINGSGNELNPESVKLMLGTIVESFDKHFDPADKFQEYVLVSLCKSILENISE